MNALNDLNRFPSLLPYLQRTVDNPCVSLSLISQDQPVSGRPFPFSVLGDSDPIARLIEGTFVTDCGTVLKKIFLQVPRDQYLVKRDDLWPLTNSDLDNFWRNAFSLHQKEEDDQTWTVLSCQVSDDGRLNLLSSLFYCAKTRLFFHPPCPRCGLPLQLCVDDELLVLSGLRPYTGSLKRYLYCNACSKQGEPVFYGYETDHAEPSFLKDRRALIHDFGLVRESKDPVSPFPCLQCPEHQHCYGPEQLAQEHVVPFSFYPFYMFIFTAPSLNSLDFLPLLSGMPVPELKNRLDGANESGRLNCLEDLRSEGLSNSFICSPDDDRLFLEILYLKLSFLGDVATKLFARSDIFNHPEMRLSGASIWVNLPEQSGRLPYFWNFNVKILDIVKPASDANPKIDGTSPDTFLDLGLLWFYTLLGNKNQNSNKVFVALREELSGNRAITAEMLLMSEQRGMFQPENVFWHPAGKNIPKGWQIFWEHALNLGLSMFHAAWGSDRQWSGKGFFVEFENVRTEIRDVLFGRMPAVQEESEHAGQRAGDQELYSIIKRIREKWQNRTEEKQNPEKYGAFKEVTETVILSAASNPMPLPSLRQNDASQETVLLTPATGAETLPFTPPSTTTKEPSTMDTVLLAPGNTREASPFTPQPVTTEETGGEETVVLRPAQANNAPPIPLEPNKRDEYLAETVILTRGTVDKESAVLAEAKEDSVTEKPAQRADDSAQDDDLAETVILAPRKSRESEKGGG